MNRPTWLTVYRCHEQSGSFYEILKSCDHRHDWFLLLSDGRNYVGDLQYVSGWVPASIDWSRGISITTQPVSKASIDWEEAGENNQTKMNKNSSFTSESQLRRKLRCCQENLHWKRYKKCTNSLQTTNNVITILIPSLASWFPKWSLATSPCLREAQTSKKAD